ncbi:DUF1707 SHOCT-like domain-containing protein [Kribbella shirazensis]|uniref:DUF1707 domain-containing protein n=1 Tax=Kribbella shirazensis TaxID=1105143 RepID=A0A7X5V795_9ACTN|nr:DUF1707 domain-containing protein [Kribbella shirazensis]NIK55935.1 hypothetical protein [Kribbella shirazensis]
MAEQRPVKAGEWVGMAAPAGREAREVAARRRLANIRLTEEERHRCTDDLAEQFAIGRLDEDELHRRVDLLNNAVTHGELQPVFAGLPTPSLYKIEPRKPGRWRWAAFVGAVWMALPFALTGLVFLVFGREIAAAIFGLPALAWVFFTYRWASRPRREERKQSGP